MVMVRALGGVAALSLRASQAAPAGTGLQRVDWVRTPFEPDADDDGAGAGRIWAVLGAGPLAEQVAAAVRAGGIAASLCLDMDAVDALDEAPGVVMLPFHPDAAAVPHAVAFGANAGDLPHAVHEGLGALLETVQRWVADDRGGARLVVLADPDALATAPAWGLLRSAAAEHPGRFALAHVDDRSRAGGGCWPPRWTPASRNWWCGTVRCWSRGSPRPGRRAARPT